MSVRNDIVASAERVFDHCGFAGAGVDRLTRAAGVSSRTLYKHLGGKTQLIVAVLTKRSERFFARFDGHGVDALFAALDDWIRVEGARGCLFLRAQGESSGSEVGVADAVAGYRRGLLDLIERAVCDDIGRHDDALAEQILVLFEGAVAAASYRGGRAISAARAAAAALVRAAG